MDFQLNDEQQHLKKSVREFAERCEKFTRGGNPLFIPETNGGGAGAVNVLYAVGRHDAICFSCVDAFFEFMPAKKSPISSI